MSVDLADSKKTKLLNLKEKRDNTKDKKSKKLSEIISFDVVVTY